MTCLGYASFIERSPTMQEWLHPFKNDFENVADGGRELLTDLQNLLLELVRQLDDKQKRYPFALKKA